MCRHNEMGLSKSELKVVTYLCYVSKVKIATSFRPMLHCAIAVSSIMTGNLFLQMF